MNAQSIRKFLKLVKFDRRGLVPVVVQDNGDGAVLMVAYMNKKSLFLTMKEGQTCFWSRSRNKLWRKGEQSGNRQIVQTISIDCDGDCMVVRIKQLGGAACHTGYRSCFYRTVNRSGQIKISGKRIFNPEKVY